MGSDWFVEAPGTKYYRLLVDWCSQGHERALAGYWSCSSVARKGSSGLEQAKPQTTTSWSYFLLVYMGFGALEWHQFECQSAPNSWRPASTVPVHQGHSRPLQSQIQLHKWDYDGAGASTKDPGTWNQKPGPSSLNQPPGLESHTTKLQFGGWGSKLR